MRITVLSVKTDLIDGMAELQKSETLESELQKLKFWESN